MVSPYSLFATVAGMAQVVGGGIYSTMQGNSVSSYNPNFNAPSPVIRSVSPKLTIGAFPDDSDVEELSLSHNHLPAPSKTPMMDKVLSDIDAMESQIASASSHSTEIYFDAQEKFESIKSEKSSKEETISSKESKKSAPPIPPVRKARLYKVGQQKRKVVFAHRLPKAKKPQEASEEKPENLTSSLSDIKQDVVTQQTAQPVVVSEIPPQSSQMQTKTEDIKPSNDTSHVIGSTTSLTMLPPVPMTDEEVTKHLDAQSVFPLEPEGTKTIEHQGKQYKVTITHKEEAGRKTALEEVKPLSFWESIKQKITNLISDITKKALTSLASLSPF